MRLPLWTAPQQLILASRSASRQTLLQSAGIDFESVPADIDERAIEADCLRRGASAVEVGMALARRKGAVIADRFPGRIVLAADQVLVLGDRLLAKPVDRNAAADQLAALSGQTHHLLCAMVLVRDGDSVFESLTRAEMRMRLLSPAFIDLYLEAAGPAALTSVGGYQFEGLGIHLFESVVGDQSTILGLSLLPLMTFLRQQAWIAA